MPNNMFEGFRNAVFLEYNVTVCKSLIGNNLIIDFAKDIIIHKLYKLCGVHNCDLTLYNK